MTLIEDPDAHERYKEERAVAAEERDEPERDEGCPWCQTITLADGRLWVQQCRGCADHEADAAERAEIAAAVAAVPPIPETTGWDHKCECGALVTFAGETCRRCERAW